MSDCLACVNWVCDDCGAVCRYASRFSEEAQHCSNGSGPTGLMAASPRGRRLGDPH